MEIASRRRVDSTFEAAAGHLGNRGGFASDAIEAEIVARGYDGEYLRYQNARNETGMSSSSSIEAFGKTVAMIRRPSGVTSFLHKKIYIYSYYFASSLLRKSYHRDTRQIDVVDLPWI